MTLDPAIRPPLMAITHDRPGLSHLDQVKQLLLGGVSWIQLRMKQASEQERFETAAAAAALCRSANAILIVNDSVDIALRAGASGVHLGKEDEGWSAARKRLGNTLILGGTINNAEDVERALASGCLDYAGIGPWRHTTTKQKLAPVLGAEGIRPLIEKLKPLPAWVIGGVLPEDMASIRNLGAAGAAVSGGLIQADVGAAARSYLTFWNS